MTSALGGTYRCVGTNACGPQPSSGCVVTVAAAPQSTGSPPTQTICDGTSTTLTASFTGAPLTFVWKRNGQVVQGATTNSLTIQGSAATRR